jgi:hypothetical protein
MQIATIQELVEALVGMVVVVPLVFFVIREVPLLVVVVLKEKELQHDCWEGMPWFLKASPKCSNRGLKAALSVICLWVNSNVLQSFPTTTTTTIKCMKIKPTPLQNQVINHTNINSSNHLLLIITSKGITIILLVPLLFQRWVKLLLS